jgi:putative sporulation protein YtaF
LVSRKKKGGFMIFSIVVLSISLSIDALGVGIVYGLRRIHIPLIPKLIICFFSILYAGAALFLGSALSHVLPVTISKLIGIVILSIMGLWIILQAILKKEEPCIGSNTYSSHRNSSTLFKIVIKSLGITIQIIRNPANGDIDNSGLIDIKEALLLGLALSVDAIGVGIGSAMAGFQSFLIPFAVGLFQLTFLYIGTISGEKFALFSRINKKFLSVLPGILLLCVALIRIY